MRHSNHASRGLRRSARTAGAAAPAVAILRLALLVTIAIGCGPAAAGSTPPTPPPTPAPTPDPHLKEPVTADQIYYVIAKGGMRLYPNTATTNEGSIVKRIDADLDGWALRITAYTNRPAMQKARPWKPGGAPGRGEAPFNFSALNLVIEFGPTNRAAAPAAPDAARQATATKLVEMLDPLLWPLEQHSVVAIPGRTAPPAAAASQPAKSKAP